MSRRTRVEDSRLLLDGRLLAAAWRGDVQRLAEQLTRGADPAAQENAALVEAAALGETHVVQMLLSDSRVNAAARDNAAMRWAAMNNHVEIVRLLLRDVRVDPSRALQDAIRNGRETVVEALLCDRRADPSRNQQQALRDAVHAGHWRIVRLLIADGRASAAANDQALLTLAISRNDWRCVDALLTHPAVRLPGVLDMRDHAKPWRSLELAAVRHARSQSLDAAHKLVTQASLSGVTPQRLRVVTLLGSAAVVLKVTHVLIALPGVALPLRAMMAILQALHSIISMMPIQDLALLVIHCFSQRRRCLAARADRSLP